MSLRVDARNNLRLAGMFDHDSDYEGTIGHAVMKLVEAHYSEGHSGASSALAIDLFNRVITGKALTAKYWDEKSEQLRKMGKDHCAGMTPEEEIAWIIACIGPRPRLPDKGAENVRD